MDFRYFDRPEVFIDLSENEATCNFCGQHKDCFDAEALYGQEEISAICPECLASGKLKKIRTPSLAAEIYRS
ncbi:CbrC family protein [Pontibacter toksunensis]|uniref:CbrC family protein n=1 Tax=Pontibacter toksunensis TaxID=1332631 RepID=A0ABW6BWC5_9BACT